MAKYRELRLWDRMYHECGIDHCVCLAAACRRVVGKIMHSCIFEQQKDVFAHSGLLYLVRCRCHSDAWYTWRVGDEPFVCKISLETFEPNIIKDDTE